MIRTHPETGRKAIFVNRAFTTRINELTPAESDAVLKLLFDHCERSGLPDPVSLGEKRRGVLGQPVRDAPGDLGLLAERAQGAARHD